MQCLLKVTMTVIQDVTRHIPTAETTIHPPTTAEAKAAASMIAAGIAYATGNITLCRVTQLPKESTIALEVVEELCLAINRPFSESSDFSENSEKSLALVLRYSLGNNVLVLLDFTVIR